MELFVDLDDVHVLKQKKTRKFSNKRHDLFNKDVKVTTQLKFVTYRQSTHSITIARTYCLNV